MEFKELTQEEQERWEKLYDDEFASYDDPTLNDEARDILTAIAEKTVIWEDADALIRYAAYHAAAIKRWKSHPVVAGFLAHAYEHFIAAGSAGACCNLGTMYLCGEGVPKSVEAARELFHLGADRGDSQASVNLGYIYYYGRSEHGVDYVLAYECYARGAFIDGNPEAYWKLGDLYAHGYGVAQNDWIAWLMYTQAYNNGKDSGFAGRAAHHVADYLMTGIEDHVEENPERALRLYVEAEIGYRKSIEIGLDYYTGCLEQAIEGQARAREALAEKLRPRRWDEE